MTSFHFNALSKKFDMLDHCLPQKKTKKAITGWFWENNYLEPLKYKIFNEVFKHILKSLETI